MAGTGPRRALFIVWTDPLISVGRETFIADALRRAGGRSVVDTAAEWPRISFEEMIRLQPEFLVFASAHAADTRHDIDALRTRPGWRDLEALRRGNIVIVSDAINRPAPRMLDAVEQMARAFHPEVFSSRGHGSGELLAEASRSETSPTETTLANGLTDSDGERARHAAPLQMRERIERPAVIDGEGCSCGR
jgi:hypothetical protein